MEIVLEKVEIKKEKWMKNWGEQQKKVSGTEKEYNEAEKEYKKAQEIYNAKEKSFKDTMILGIISAVSEITEIMTKELKDKITLDKKTKEVIVILDDSGTSNIGRGDKIKIVFRIHKHPSKDITSLSFKALYGPIDHQSDLWPKKPTLISDYSQMKDTPFIAIWSAFLLLSRVIKE